MTDERTGRERAESKTGFMRFSPIQMAIAGLVAAIVLVILLLVISFLRGA